MNTELENLFLQPFQRSWSEYSENEQIHLKSLAKEFLNYLPATSGRHFSEASQKAIATKAGSLLKERLKKDLVMETWLEIVRNFYQSGFWGIPADGTITVIPKASRQTREFFAYFWVAFQALVVIKIGVLFFGLKAVEESSDEMKLAMWALIAFSFGNLIWFVVKRRKKEDSN